MERARAVWSFYVVFALLRFFLSASWYRSRALPVYLCTLSPPTERKQVHSVRSSLGIEDLLQKQEERHIFCPWNLNWNLLIFGFKIKEVTVLIQFDVLWYFISFTGMHAPTDTKRMLSEFQVCGGGVLHNL